MGLGEQRLQLAIAGLEANGDGEPIDRAAKADRKDKGGRAPTSARAAACWSRASTTATTTPSRTCGCRPCWWAGWSSRRHLLRLAVVSKNRAPSELVADDRLRLEASHGHETSLDSLRVFPILARSGACARARDPRRSVARSAARQRCVTSLELGAGDRRVQADRGVPACAGLSARLVDRGARPELRALHPHGPCDLVRGLRHRAAVPDDAP